MNKNTTISFHLLEEDVIFLEYWDDLEAVMVGITTSTGQRRTCSKQEERGISGRVKSPLLILHL